MAKEKVNIIIEGGKASPAPPIGPKFSPMGINVIKLVADINAASKSFEGIKVPVEIEVDAVTKTWTVKVGTPSVSQLLIKELKLAKGSGSAWNEGTPEKPATADNPPVVGDSKKEIIVKIAKIKHQDMGTRNVKTAVKNVLGTCVSMGITVEGKKPQEAQKDVDAGTWDNLLG
jgi:large subunit ribosomal protein L11